MRIRFFLASAVSALLVPGSGFAAESDGLQAKLAVSAQLLSATAIAPEIVPAESELAVYHVAMQLHDGTQLVASPMLDVKVGEMATVSIEDGKGQRYSVRLMPMRLAGKVIVASSIDIASGSSTYLSSPVQMAPLGEASAIELGKDSPAAKPFRLDFTLSAVTIPTS